MRKRFFLSFFAFFIVVYSWGVNALVLFQKDGTKIVFDFSERITLTFENEVLKVRTLNRVFECQFENLTDFKLDDVATGVNFSDTNDTWDVDEEKIVVRGLRHNSTVSIYSLGGQVLKQSIAGDDGTAEIDISSIPKGSYVIKTEIKNIKISK